MALLSVLQVDVPYMNKIENLASFELEFAFGDCIVCFTLARAARICICRMYMSVNMFIQILIRLLSLSSTNLNHFWSCVPQF